MGKYVVLWNVKGGHCDHTLLPVIVGIYDNKMDAKNRLVNLVKEEMIPLAKRYMKSCDLIALNPDCFDIERETKSLLSPYGSSEWLCGLDPKDKKHCCDLGLADLYIYAGVCEEGGC